VREGVYKNIKKKQLLDGLQASKHQLGRSYFFHFFFFLDLGRSKKKDSACWRFESCATYSISRTQIKKTGKMFNTVMVKTSLFSSFEIHLDESWTTIKEDYIAFLLPAPKCTNCIKQVLTPG
jgi:hypothetical protein